MKTREQLIEEIGWISDHLIATGHPEEIIDLIVSACEEAVDQEFSSILLSKQIDHKTLVTMNFLTKHIREKMLENLKKLKSK